MSSQPESFADRTMVMSGGSRRIGLAIALGAAGRGAATAAVANGAGGAQLLKSSRSPEIMADAEGS